MSITKQKLENIDYSIIRSNRKTISISILPNKEVIVRAPHQISDKTLQDLLTTKKKWIDAKLKELPPPKEPSKDTYNDGDRILYRGKEYKIKVVSDSSLRKSDIILKEDELWVFKKNNETKETKELLINWYKQQARNLVQTRMNYYNQIINKPIGKVRIKNQKSRWGSCSSKGNLNFNWRIILMPDDMCDYIIVHELCHLKYMNHSKMFWSSVESILPDYKERQRWIKENTTKLEI